MATKGKLRSSSKIFELNEEEPKLSNNVLPTVIEYEEIGWGHIIKGWVKSILVFLLLGLVLVVGAYAGLAATISYGTIDDRGEIIVVARGTYVGGVVPKDEIVYISTTHILDGNLWDNLQQGFVGIPNAATVQVLAGPVQEIEVQANQILLKKGTETVGKIEGVIEDLTPNKTVLQNEYIVRCLGGACEPGELLLIKSAQISGEVVTIRDGEITR